MQSIPNIRSPTRAHPPAENPTGAQSPPKTILPPIIAIEPIPAPKRRKKTVKLLEPSSLPDNLDTLTVKELKPLCKNNNISVTGNRQDLIRRIRDYYEGRDVPALRQRH